jgi:hypothetical protein
MKQLEWYLRAWAAFDEWELHRDGAAAVVAPDVALRSGNPCSASYLPHGYSILSGALADGSLESLHGSCARLALVASAENGRYVAELVTYVSIESFEQADLRALAVEVEGDVTARGIGLTLSLYNWRTRRWNRLRATRSSAPGASLHTWLPRESARDFVSPTGELCLGVRAEHGRTFRTRIGVVRLTVQT